MVSGLHVIAATIRALADHCQGLLLILPASRKAVGISRNWDPFARHAMEVSRWDPLRFNPLPSGGVLFIELFQRRDSRQAQLRWANSLAERCNGLL
jgi:hypothetical protein